ncbi:PREDICTED: serine/arginine repetitive matrix protein 3 [Bison bison bison]|uniref:Serine/arginine repetitive matrix protein 3 n=1 Tax=Bison bison bison TaxID=43346 RepID=A0A6P3ILB8_BISBB|nr:PREDICTED: serine/arginine repetitive matrix protein 3 [Bison bison bison]
MSSTVNNGAASVPSPPDAANGFPQPGVSSGAWPRAEEELRATEPGLVKRAHREILDHERKRRVELKCMELQEMMEEQGYSEEETRQKVRTFRQMLMEKEGMLTREDRPGGHIVAETPRLIEGAELGLEYAPFDEDDGPVDCDLPRSLERSESGSRRKRRHRSRSPKSKRKEKNKERKRPHTESPGRRSHRHSSGSSHSPSLSSHYSNSRSPSSFGGQVLYPQRHLGPWYCPCPKAPPTVIGDQGNRSRSAEKRARSPSRSPSPKKTLGRDKDGESRARHAEAEAARARRRSRSYSPIRKRRRDSPSFMEPRRITSARKRPIPYYRPSPSSSSSCLSSDYSSRSPSPSPSPGHSHGSYSSRSRTRSRTRSPSQTPTPSYHSRSSSESGGF